MVAGEKTVQIIITTKNVSEKAREYHYVVNGIDGLYRAIGFLVLNNEEVIYVHITESIDCKTINKVLNDWCKKLEIDRGATNVTYQVMGMPEKQEGFHTIIDVDNKLKENKYLVSFKIP